MKKQSIAGKGWCTTLYHITTTNGNSGRAVILANKMETLTLVAQEYLNFLSYPRCEDNRKDIWKETTVSNSKAYNNQIEFYTM